MERWYRVTREGWTVQNHFKQRWERAGEPRNAALYGRIEVGASKRTFYFSPGAVRLMPDLVDAYGATRCDMPELSKLVLLAGDQTLQKDSPVQVQVQKREKTPIYKFS